MPRKPAIMIVVPTTSIECRNRLAAKDLPDLIAWSALGDAFQAPGEERDVPAANLIVLPSRSADARRMERVSRF
jgi:hypothetical protein